MKVETSNNTSITSYNNDEWDFIDTLDEVAKRYIRMGLTTPYDYGYKPQNNK